MAGDAVLLHEGRQFGEGSGEYLLVLPGGPVDACRRSTEGEAPFYEVCRHGFGLVGAQEDHHGGPHGGEAAEILAAMSRNGFFKQMTHHSTTSQYGTLSRGPKLINEQMLAKAREFFLKDVREGRFVREWSDEQAGGARKLEALREKALAHPMSRAEDAVIGMIQSAHSI